MASLNKDQQGKHSAGHFKQAQANASRQQQFSSYDFSSGAVGFNDSLYEDEPAKKSKLWIIPVVLVVVLLAAYGAGVAYFSNNYLPNTVLDGTDVSLKSREEVAQALESSLSGYSTAVEGDGISFTLKAADINLRYDGDAYASAAMAKTSPFTWPAAFFTQRNLTVGSQVTYDETSLATLLQTYVDAGKAGDDSNDGVTYDETQGKYTYTQQALVGRIDVTAACAHIGEKIAGLPSSIALGEESLAAGADIQTAVDTANAYLAAGPVLTLANTTVTEVTSAQIASWISFGDDMSVSLDTDAITTWCKGDLSNTTDTVGKSRTFTRPDGKVVTTQASGVYGWSINGAETATQIADAIKSGTKQTIEMPCYDTADRYNPGGQDWPDRYIDVDISTQHATFYENGQVIWEADVVTGLPADDRDTPQGVWTITSRDTDATLTGPNDENGNPEWESHVDFWMGVKQNIVGFHNAPWRYYFGGEIYKTNGSHGCINLSYDDAEKLYNLCKVGDVVVIHE